MNTHDRDELEIELATLRPYEPSRSFEQRIANALMVPHHRRRNRTLDSLLRAGIVAGGLVAASVVFMLGRGDVGPSGPAGISEISHAALRSAWDEQTPSLWVYRQASLRSTSEFDALLDRHARGRSDSTSDPTHRSLFLLMDHELNSPSGEM